MFTIERLKELSGMKIIEAADRIYPKEIKEAIDELLAIREAGDEEVGNRELELACVKSLVKLENPDDVQKVTDYTSHLRTVAIARGQQLREAQAENTRLEQYIARLKVEYDNLENRFDATNKACDIFEKNSKAAADLCDENWKLKAEIERLKEENDSLEVILDDEESNAQDDLLHKQHLQSRVDTITAERDAARKESERLTGCLKKANSGFEEHERLWYLEQNKTESLTAELAALKSAPGMADVDAILQDTEKSSEQIESDLADLARRSIAARDEVAGLLKWFRGWVNNDRFMDEVYEGTGQAIRINEIVPAKPGRRTGT